MRLVQDGRLRPAGGGSGLLNGVPIGSSCVRTMKTLGRAKGPYPLRTPLVVQDSAPVPCSFWRLPGCPSIRTSGLLPSAEWEGRIGALAVRRLSWRSCERITRRISRGQATRPAGVAPNTQPQGGDRL